MESSTPPAWSNQQAGTPWGDIDGSPDWGAVRLGLADPDTGIADQEAWKLIAAQNPPTGFGEFVPLRQTTDGAVLAEMVLFPSWADIVVSSEVAIASQLENAPRRGAGRIQVYYPDPTPYLPVAASWAAAVLPRTSSRASPRQIIRPSSVAWV